MSSRRPTPRSSEPSGVPLCTQRPSCSHTLDTVGAAASQRPQGSDFLWGTCRPPTLTQVSLRRLWHFMLMSPETLKSFVRRHGADLGPSQSSPKPLDLHNWVRLAGQEAVGRARGWLSPDEAGRPPHPTWRWRCAKECRHLWGQEQESSHLSPDLPGGKGAWSWLGLGSEHPLPSSRRLLPPQSSPHPALPLGTLLPTTHVAPELQSPVVCERWCPVAC